jgi:flagellar FliJ protein
MTRIEVFKNPTPEHHMSNELQLAVDLSLERRDAVAVHLAQTRQHWTSAQLQLDQLENYADETTMRWTSQLNACTPELMRHHYQFMERLTHAITLQRGAVADQFNAMARIAAALRDAEARLQSLRELVAIRQREQQQAQSRRDQKYVDEFASQQFRRRAMMARSATAP